MKRSSGIFLSALSLFISVAASGCANKADSAANAIRALMSDDDGLVHQYAFQLQEHRRKAEGQAWLKRFELESKLRSEALSDPCAGFSSATCTPADPPSDGQMDCATTCTGSSSDVTTETCTLVGEPTAQCGADTYTFRNGSFRMVAPPATCTAAGTVATLNFGFTIDFNFELKGGEIEDFVRLECAMGLNMKFSYDTATSASTSEFDVNDGATFTCSIDGSEIELEELDEIMSESSCS